MTTQPKPAPPHPRPAPQAETPPPRAASASDEGGFRIGGLRVPLPEMPASLPKRALWWGGLAALAVAGVVEWPVAAVVGAGTYVAERLSREDARAR
jgi:hypothetical protein